MMDFRSWKMWYFVGATKEPVVFALYSIFYYYYYF